MDSLERYGSQPFIFILNFIQVKHYKHFQIKLHVQILSFKILWWFFTDIFYNNMYTFFFFVCRLNVELESLDLSRVSDLRQGEQWFGQNSTFRYSPFQITLPKSSLQMNELDLGKVL